VPEYGGEGSEAYQKPATGQRIKPGAKLDAEYFDKNSPVARKRPYEASIRLAAVLNEAFAQHLR
jgi:hypothetical protein